VTVDHQTLEDRTTRRDRDTLRCPATAGRITVARLRVGRGKAEADEIARRLKDDPERRVLDDQFSDPGLHVGPWRGAGGVILDQGETDAGTADYDS